MDVLAAWERLRSRRIAGWVAAHRVALAAAGASLAVGAALGLMAPLPAGSRPAAAVADVPVTASPTPDATGSPAPTVGATDGPTAAPGATSRPASAPATPFGERVASERSLLPDAWADRAFGNGRPLGRGLGGEVEYGCYGPADNAAARSWAWPDETAVRELVQTSRGRAAATKAFDDCVRSLRADHGAGPVHGRPVAVGDAAVLVRTDLPLAVTVTGAARIGTTRVTVAWTQSGTIASDAPAERLLRAAVAAFLEQPLPEAVPAAAPDPADGTAGYLSALDLHRAWSGDHLVHDSLACGSPDDGSQPTPAPTALRLGAPAVSRGWYSSANEPEFSWGFVRARAPDEQAAHDDVVACRASTPDATTLPDVGDEAYCTPDNLAYGGLRCVARRGASFYVYSESTGSPTETAAKLLRLAISRDGAA